MDETSQASVWTAAVVGAALAVAACGDAGDATTDASSDSATTEGAATTTASTAGSSSSSSTSASATATGPTTTGPTTTGTSDSDTATTGEPPELADVGHAREFRAAWVATVYNINFPSAAGIDVAAMEAELVAFLDTLALYNLNAVVFQARPESDAVYDSSLEPWSRYLTGTQGQAPEGGFDPLAFLCDEAHARGVEVHAWFNPYRAKADKDVPAVAPHVSLALPEHAHVYGDLLWMDPGSVDVRAWVVDVAVDVAERYDIDGLHFDDYFYPYPNGDAFPDGATWSEYQDGGGMLTKDDWRRDNVNRLVEDVADALARARPDVRFGISPFGIYRPGMPEGIVGLDQYAELYSDPVKWMEEGWVDYLAPQLYWPSTQTQQAYGPLVEWWSALTADGQGYTFVGNYLSKVGSEPAWGVDEFETQLELTRGQADSGALGNIYFHIEPLMGDAEGVATMLRENFYPGPVLTPALAAFKGATIEPPALIYDDGETVELAAPVDAVGLRAYVVYEDAGDGWQLVEIAPAPITSLDLAPGTRWAVSAVDRRGVESPGVVIDR